MCLIFFTFSLFLLVSVSHLVVCSSIDTPLDWFDPWLAFYHFLLCIHIFLAKSRIHTELFFKQSCTYSLLVEFDVVGSCWVGCECGWVFLGFEVVY